MAEVRSKSMFARRKQLLPAKGSKTILATLFLLGAALLSGSCGGLPTEAAVRVNDIVITKDDVESRMNYLSKLYPGMVSRDDEVNFANIRRQTTRDLVLAELERQEAERRNITVSTSDVDDELQTMAEDDFLSDMDRMIEDYARKGISLEELRTVTRERLLHQKLMADESASIPVSELDIQNYYEKNRQQYDQPDLRQTRQIVTDSQAAALDAISRISAGESFVEVAKQLSVEPSASRNGGNLGLVAPGKLPPELDSVLLDMSLGQISDPINVADKWYVLTVEAIQPGQQLSLDEAKAEIKMILTGESSAVNWKTLMDDLYNQATLEYSPDYDPGLK